MKKQIFVALTGAVAATAQAAEFKLPAFETAKLPNGLTVYMMERHDVPLVAVRAVVKAGAVNDGKQAGLANLTGDGVLLGSTKHSKATSTRLSTSAAPSWPAAAASNNRPSPPTSPARTPTPCCRCSQNWSRRQALMRPSWTSCVHARSTA